MKALLIVLVIALVAGLVYNMKQEETDIPEAPEYAFHKMHPESECQWHKEYGTFEAEVEGGSAAFIFDEKGDFLFQENEKNLSDLPSECVAYVTRNFSIADITEISEVTDVKNNKTYEVEVKNQNLIFNLEGKFIGKEKSYSEIIDTRENENGIRRLWADQ